MLPRTKNYTVALALASVLLAGCSYEIPTPADSSKVTINSPIVKVQPEKTPEATTSSAVATIEATESPVPVSVSVDTKAEKVAKETTSSLATTFDVEPVGLVDIDLPDFVNLVVSPNVDNELLINQKYIIKDMLDDIKDYFKPNKITIVLFTEKDGEWGDNVIAELGGSSPNGVSSQVPRDPNSDCGFGGASLDNWGDPITYACTNSSGYRSFQDMAILPHEIWHMVHFEVAIGVLPLWWTEGAASWFGNHYAHDGHVKTPKETIMGTYRFNSTKAGMERGIPYQRAMANITPEQVAILMDAFDNNNGQLDRELYAHYSVGEQAVKLIVNRYGIQSVVQFYQDIDHRLGPHGWRQSFEKVFGLSVEEFYVEFAGELNEFYKDFK